LKGPDTIGKNEPPVLTPLFYSKDKRLFHSKNFGGNSKREYLEMPDMSRQD
jgi:hypothetical protein